MTTTLDYLRQRRVQLLNVAAQYGASHVRVFGSVARGEDTDDSDVDFLVCMEKGRSLLDLAGLRDDLEETLSRPVDVVSENGIFPFLRQRILREALPL